MLIVVEAIMLKSTSQAKMFGGSVSKISMDIDNGNISSLEKVSLPNGKRSTKVKPIFHMIKRKGNSEIVPCANPKCPCVSIANRRGIGHEAAQTT